MTGAITDPHIPTARVVLGRLKVWSCPCLPGVGATSPDLALCAGMDPDQRAGTIFPSPRKARP